MNETEQSKNKAGAEELRELDAWIALNLFGWRREVRERYAGVNTVEGFGLNMHLPLGHFEREFVPAGQWPKVRYSTDPAAAMQVLEICAEIKLETIKIWMTSSFEWCVSCGLHACANTLPLAICLLAKKLFRK